MRFSTLHRGLFLTVIASMLAFVPLRSHQSALAQDSCAGLLEILRGQASLLAGGDAEAQAAIAGVQTLAAARIRLDALARSTSDEYGAVAKGAAANAVRQIDACLATQNTPPPAGGQAAPLPPANQGGQQPPGGGNPQPGQGPGLTVPAVPPLSDQGGRLPGGAGASASGGAANPPSGNAGAPSGGPTGPASGGLATNEPTVDLSRAVGLIRKAETEVGAPGAQSRALLGGVHALDDKGPAPSIRRFDRQSGNTQPLADTEVRDGDTLALGRNTVLPFTVRNADGKLVTGTVLSSDGGYVTFTSGKDKGQASDDLFTTLLRAARKAQVDDATGIEVSGSARIRLWNQPDSGTSAVRVTTTTNPSGPPNDVAIELYRGGGSSGTSILESISRLVDQTIAYVRQSIDGVQVYFAGKVEVQSPRREQTESLLDAQLRQSLNPPTTYYTSDIAVTHKDTAFSVEFGSTGGQDRSVVSVTEGSVTVKRLSTGETETISAGGSKVFDGSTNAAGSNGAVILGAVGAVIVLGGVAAFMVMRRRGGVPTGA